MQDRTSSSPQSSLPVQLRLANTLGRGLARVGIRSQLSSAQLIHRAKRRTGLSDFGSPDIHEPLDVLIDSLQQEARLTPVGELVAGQVLTEILVKRLYLAEQHRQRPESLDRPIERPLFIVGLPRSGTTLLHNLLSQAPGARALRTWEVAGRAGQMFGARRPQPGGDWITRGVIRYLNQGTPGLAEVHPLVADNIEECTMPLMNSLNNLGFLLMGPLHRYRKWHFEHGLELLPQAYQLHQQQLNILARDERFDHWVLKAPTHLAGLEALLTVYPAAQVVLTERDPAEALTSSCSLFAVVRRMFCESVDRLALGDEIGDMLGHAVTEAAKVRERFADRIFPVSYRELVAQPIATVQQLYERLGRQIDTTMEQGVRGWLKANPQHKNGVHRYCAADFGVDITTWKRRYGEAYETLFACSPMLRTM